VFIFAGGDPPFTLLERAGVSFNPADRQQTPTVVEPGTRLLAPVLLTFAGSLAAILWASWFRAYYQIDPDARAHSPLHALLRPTAPVGLSTGLIACVLFAANLAYLIRRSTSFGRLLPGSLRNWMSCHVLTGLLSVLFVLVHCGFSMRQTVGGHALAALGVVVLSGSIGRYLYTLVPRAANGTEASLDELRSQLAQLFAQWDLEGRGFGAEVQRQIDELIIDGRWRASLLARIGVLVTGQFRLRRCLAQLRCFGRAEGVSEPELRRVLFLAVKAHRLRLLVTHYDEIAAVVSSWRYFHRWLGLLMILLTIIHIFTATRYASLDTTFLWPKPGVLP